MGRKCPCEDVILPPKPANDFCVALSDGSAYCPKTETIIPAAGLVCRKATDDTEIWTWIDFVVDAIK